MAETYKPADASSRCTWSTADTRCVLEPGHSGYHQGPIGELFDDRSDPPAPPAPGLKTASICPSCGTPVSLRACSSMHGQVAHVSCTFADLADKLRVARACGVGLVLDAVQVGLLLGLIDEGDWS